MSLSSIVFIVILAFFTWRGYQKGFVGAITRVLSFLIAYPAAIFLTKPFANLLRTYTGLDGLILFLIAGCSIFLLASLAVTLLLNAGARLIPSNEFTDTSSKIGGAAFGIIFGGVVGLIAVYIVNVVAKPSAATQITQQKIQENDLQNKDLQNNDEAENIKKYVMAEGAPTNDSFIDTTAKKLVSTAASTAVGIVTSDKTSSQLTKVMTQDPQATLTHVQNMTNNGEFRRLLDKPDFQAELTYGNVETLMQNKDFQTLIQNPDMQAIISASGDADNGKSAEQAAAAKMIQAWQKVASLKNDPRVLNIVNDEAFQAQLNSPNKLPLLMNPKFRELSEIIFNGSSDGVPEPDSLQPAPKKPKIHYTVEDITQGTSKRTSEPTAESEEQKKAAEPEEKIYKWTDENGKVHYSDKPIKN